MAILLSCRSRMSSLFDFLSPRKACHQSNYIKSIIMFLNHFQENKNSKASETAQISKFINVKFPLFLMQKLVIIVTSKGLKCIPIPPCKCLMLTLLNVVGKKFNFPSFITSLIRYPITKENNFKFFYCYYVHKYVV